MEGSPGLPGNCQPKPQELKQQGQDETLGALYARNQVQIPAAEAQQQLDTRTQQVHDGVG